MVAILFGYLIFGDIPDIYIVTGALMIVASGLYTIYREKVRIDAGPVAASSTTRPSP